MSTYLTLKELLNVNCINCIRAVLCRFELNLKYNCVVGSEVTMDGKLRCHFCLFIVNIQH